MKEYEVLVYLKCVKGEIREFSQRRGKTKATILATLCKEYDPEIYEIIID